MSIVTIFKKFPTQKSCIKHLEQVRFKAQQKHGRSMRLFQREFVLISVLLIFTSNTGCSVGMAMSGEPAPDFDRLVEEVNRGEAPRVVMEFILGHPVRTITLDDDESFFKPFVDENGARLDIYEYESGNEPNMVRAVIYMGLNMLTYGLWEIVEIPIEIFLYKGRTYVVNIVYDAEDKVVTISPPIIKPEE